MREYQFKTISRDSGIYLIVKFYKSLTMGECHAGYLKIAAESEAEALRIAGQAMG